MVNLRKFKTSEERRKALQEILGVSLENIGCHSLDEATASSRNCENMIGVAQIPLGVAGPLKLTTHNSRLPKPPPAKQALRAGGTGGQAQPITCFIPLATTEGALVASVNRGCKAISESGGATVFGEKVGMTRGPVFKTESLAHSFKLVNWLKNHSNDLYHWTSKTSKHLRLLKIEPQVLGRLVFARFYFDTGKAMGMNMVTIATDSIIQIIEKRTGSKCLSITGNFCVDKKPAWLNFILGRGRMVWAEAVLRREIVEKILKTTPEKIYEVWLAKCLLGSALAGSMGFNAHFANIIAAIFCATGQDLAQVTEGSLGVTTTEVVDKDLYISVYLPDLALGVVGGGTGLATQTEALKIIFSRRKPMVEEFSAVLGGAVLAGELSLLASLAEGSLAKAHQKLGRGKTYLC